MNEEQFRFGPGSLIPLPDYDKDETIRVQKAHNRHYAPFAERERALDPSAFKRHDAPKPLRCDALERIIEEAADRQSIWAGPALAQLERLTAASYEFERMAVFGGGTKHKIVRRET